MRYSEDIAQKLAVAAYSMSVQRSTERSLSKNLRPFSRNVLPSAHHVRISVQLRLPTLRETELYPVFKPLYARDPLSLSLFVRTFPI